MKKLLCVFLCIAFLFISAACNSNKTIASSSETTTSQPHTEPYHPDGVSLRFNTLDELIHAHQNGYPKLVEMISQRENEIFENSVDKDIINSIDKDFLNATKECFQTLTSHALYKPSFNTYPVPEVIFEYATIYFWPLMPTLMNPPRSRESVCFLTTVWSEPRRGSSLEFTHVFYMNDEATLNEFKSHNKSLAESNYKKFCDLESGQKVLARYPNYYLEEDSLYFRVKSIDWEGGPLIEDNDEYTHIYFGLEKIADPPCTTQK